MERESRDLMVGGRRDTDWAERRADWSFKYFADPVALQWSELSVGPHHAGPGARPKKLATSRISREECYYDVTRVSNHSNGKN